MGNHNIRITNPKGEYREQFAENQTMGVCREWLQEYGPAPIGWFYQIINHNKKARNYPEFTKISGFNDAGDVVDIRKAHVQHNNGRWYTPKKAKRDMRAQGASWFKREKVWTQDID